MIEERKTSQKVFILEYLKNAPGHPSAHTVYREVKKKLPRISLGTVYRTLKSLKEKSIVQEILSAESRYDGDIDSHAHFICQKCHKVFDIFEACCLKKNPALQNYQQCEVYTRVVGYLRPVQQWHIGKQQEYQDRQEYCLPKSPKK